MLFLAGVAVLAWLVAALGVGDILSLVARTGWFLPLILAVYAGCQLSRAGALWLCQPQADRIPYRHVLAIRVSAEAVRLLTFTGPVLSEPSKVWLFGRRGVEAKAGVATIIAELLAHSLVATTLSIGAFLYLISMFDVEPYLRRVGTVAIVLLSAYVVCAALAIRFRVYVIGAVAGFLWRRGRLRFIRDVADVRLMEDQLLFVLRDRPWRLAGILTCDVAANAFLMLEIAVTLVAMGISAPAHYASVIEGCVKFISIAFFFIPTQVGVSEGTYAGLFNILGLTAAGGVSLALVRRLRTLAVAGIGLVLVAVLSSKRRRGRDDEDEDENQTQDDDQRSAATGTG